VEISNDRRERTRLAITTSRHRIARSRRMIRATRVLTVPIAGSDGSGASVSPIHLRGRIRRLIEVGALPTLSDRRSWVGQGQGDTCRLCEQEITAAQWQHEVDTAAGEIRTHGVCFRMWHEESQDLRKTA
jgi:hypothetical protein